jgi:zinc finger CCCH domain-containing protein 13
MFPTVAIQTANSPVTDISSPTAPAHQFNPPVGSRLLALASRTAPMTSGNKPLHSPDINTLTQPGTMPLKLGGMTPPPGISINMLSSGPDAMNSFSSEPHLGANPRATPSDRSGRSYSPFNLTSQSNNAMEEMHDAMRAEAGRRPQPVIHPDRHFLGASEASSPYTEQAGSPNFTVNAPGFELGGNAIGSGPSGAKGSRFAKFFDAKNREPQISPVSRRTPVQPGLVPTPPLPNQRQDSMVHNGIQTAAENRAMEDLFAKLQNSTQVRCDFSPMLSIYVDYCLMQNHRASPQLQQTNRVPSGSNLHGQGPIDIQLLQQQQFAQQNARLDSLYDSRLDDRNFVPDGLVPGLRPAQRPRSREPTGVLFNEQLDDPLHFNARLQQQRNLEQLYPAQAQAFNQLGRGGVALQQAHLREAQIREAQIREAQLREAQLREAQLREAAVMREAQIREAQLRAGASLNPQAAPQRLPPGLANLGGRPPHDPAQYLNSQLNSAGGLLQSLQPQGGPTQQRFDGFGGGAGNFNAPAVARGPVPGPHHQNLAFNQMSGLGPGASVELRNQNQLLGMGGVGGLGGNGRGLGPGFPQHQQHQQQQLQAQLALRQQQQQHLAPHVLQHGMIPPHLQHQQPSMPIGNTQGTADLMALLMGGQRE